MGDQFPDQWNEPADQITKLRYGENPHQECTIYDDPTATEPNVVDAEQVKGEKGMSYLNYVDAAGGLELIKEFREPAAAVIKHVASRGRPESFSRWRLDRPLKKNFGHGSHLYNGLYS